MNASPLLEYVRVVGSSDQIVMVALAQVNDGLRHLADYRATGSIASIDSESIAGRGRFITGLVSELESIETGNPQIDAANALYAEGLAETGTSYRDIAASVESHNADRLKIEHRDLRSAIGKLHEAVALRRAVV